MSRLFLIPLAIALLWTLYLLANGWNLKQGLKGYRYIAIATAFFVAFFTLLLWLTK
ncbi:hypothetical protein [Paraferrimonas haliotis]|uniref:Uncharacterized protein n=1 Tax=Paraferrimonas haliotis TaxID=2013866 RepID=A0AA37WXP0_9GAMM|nr:hypothetical protein [Paraferrimonas haliotis]GLS82790.1 hypothetical protein GCM10007894_07670 [Paraferrimonas haliotis]